MNFSRSAIDGQAAGGIFPFIKLLAIGPEAVAPLRSVLFFPTGPIDASTLP
jgi:hypothetical protein